MIASANSFNVFNVCGAESINRAISECTNAVVAICVVFVEETAVGAIGTPVKLGSAMDAFVFKLVSSTPTWSSN